MKESYYFRLFIVIAHCFFAFRQLHHSNNADDRLTVAVSIVPQAALIREIAGDSINVVISLAGKAGKLCPVNGCDSSPFRPLFCHWCSG